MSGTILDLEPKRLWYYFNEICNIPHGSDNEAKLVEYISNFAKENGCEYLTDEIGNIVVRKAATSSEHKVPIVLQGHLDMVCESDPKITHDFLKDPIKTKIEDGWVTADGTTLGADNGIGVAAALAVLESNDIKHGPLECLFTVQEETGLYGAAALQPDFVKGRTLINTDTEVDGVIYVGCAGGKFLSLNVPYAFESVPSGYTGLEIAISELSGGHSGIAIHEQKGNSLKIAARLLAAIRNDYDLLLSSFNGGTAHNVIPSTASAVFVVKNDNVDGAKKIINDVWKQVKNELKKSDPEARIEVKDASPDKVIGQDATDKIVRFTDACYHGVYAMSLDIDGLVQTSFNFAKVVFNEDHCYIETSIRSSVASEMNMVKSRFCSMANLMGLEAVEFGGYPGWEPNMESPIFNASKRVYKEITGKEAGVAAIHAGLECGLVGEKYEGMDMVSIGMQLEGAHSFNEKVQIKSVEDFWTFLVKLIEDYKG